MKQTIQAYTTGPWRIQGNELVAPVTLVREGVHHGSQGPIYWSAHVLEANAHKWENVPVSLDHPTANGHPISIKNAPGQAIGRIRYARYDSQKKAIRGEVHIPANHPQASRVQSITEVSMGVFSDERYEGGQWNGKEYHACAIAMEPDHLALLSEEQGACSWEDGCGIRNNEAQGNELLQQAVTTYVNNLMRGGNTMSDEKLLPPGVNKKESAQEPDLQKMQEQADSKDLLLPAQFNRSGKKQAQQDENADILLPTGMNK